MFFDIAHLNFAKQTYSQHFKDALFYSLLSAKAAVYFLIHSIFPEYFVSSGSETIETLHEIICAKKAALTLTSE